MARQHGVQHAGEGINDAPASDQAGIGPRWGAPGPTYDLNGQHRATNDDQCTSAAHPPEQGTRAILSQKGRTRQGIAVASHDVRLNRPDRSRASPCGGASRTAQPSNVPEDASSETKSAKQYSSRPPVQNQATDTVTAKFCRKHGRFEFQVRGS
jgi:hypothetical protein